MIVTDLDKSLLRSDKTISDFSRTVFYQCKNKNMIIVFATARPVRSTKAFIDDIKPDAVIYHNGAIVTVNENLLYSNKIAAVKAKALLKIIEEKFPESAISVEINDKMYTNFDIFADIEYKRISFNDLPNMDVDKILIDNIPIDKIMKIKKYLPGGLYLQIDSAGFGFIMKKGVSKWHGIKILMKYFKTKRKDILSFGDDYNDLLMIKKCGIGVAMENGIDEVKKCSKSICRNNDEDGIAIWIKENILSVCLTSLTSRSKMNHL